MSTIETTGRFMRPIDVTAGRRGRRSTQLRRVVVLVANITLALTVVLGAGWLWRQAHRDERFAIQTIHVTGRRHAAGAAVEKVLDAYEGANLFRLDIPALQAKLVAIPWIESAAVEKALPDKLAIQLVERVPAALVEMNGELRYIDANGVIFAAFNPANGGAALPRITGANREEAAGCVAYLERLRKEAPDLFARVVEISPANSSGWIIRDRALEAPITVPDGGSVPKWRMLDRIAAADGLDGATLDYADLRFRRQIVVKRRGATGAVTDERDQQRTGEGAHVKD